MSRSNFSHFFRARTGLTPAHFSTEVRVHEAGRTLLTSRAPLKQIAKAFGFRNPSYFCRLFRLYQHLSPDSYCRTIR
jgi:AraC-like DNA-binding protein